MVILIIVSFDKLMYNKLISNINSFSVRLENTHCGIGNFRAILVGGGFLTSVDFRQNLVAFVWYIWSSLR